MTTPIHLLCYNLLMFRHMHLVTMELEWEFSRATSWLTEISGADPIAAQARQACSLTQSTAQMEG